MPRLLSDSDGFAGITDWAPVTGPNARNSGSTTAQDGGEQTFDAYGDVVAFEFALNIKQGQGARRQRGLLTALRAGNAMRLRFYDPDMMRPAQAGIDVAQSVDWPSLPAQTWSNGMPWSNGEGWRLSAPVVAVAADAAIRTGVVRLADTTWGHGLGYGDYIGFFPFHLGIYMVTEVVDNGEYRLWPLLRGSLTTAHYATLFPTVAMRPRINTMPPGRGLAATEAATVTMVEVQDYYVRERYEG